MTLGDDLDAIDSWEGRAYAARRERDRLKTQVGRLVEENQRLRSELALVDGIMSHVPDPPEWVAPPPSGRHHGTAVFVMSDTHYDEVVRPAEVLGLNAYDRGIAEARTRKAFEGAVNLPRHWLGSNLRYDGIVLAHAGDLITGEIHDELAESNEAKPTETIEFFLDPVVAGIRMLREEYGRVHVVAVDGNHDRLYRKRRAKGAASSSWSRLFWTIVAREMSRYKTVTFQIPESRETIFPVYDTRILMHHGDAFRGGSGISGALTPLSIGDYRVRRKHQDAQRYAGRDDLRYDLQVTGHIHHRNSLPGMVTVGTLKGYDEYAMTSNFPFEPPSQELLIITPERGVTFQAPIWVQDREKEGW